jgi:lipoate-protein ligase A
MHLLNHTVVTPAESLALEEALIVAAESGKITETLRFWESPTHFVVLGAGGAIAKETHIERCAADNIPILRRCSGGGTVLQGPGCLNYTLLLDRDQRPNVATITSTNHAVLVSVVRALATVGITAQLDGTSDLTANGLKFSGNAQRRRKRWILFHGTILYDFDVTLVPKYLREPERQPDYRAHRPHDQFVRNIPIQPEQFKTALAREWNAAEHLAAWPDTETQKLVSEKYSQPGWNRAF